jgi:hypothetical protein
MSARESLAGLGIKKRKAPSGPYPEGALKVLSAVEDYSSVVVSAFTSTLPR